MGTGNAGFTRLEMVDTGTNAYATCVKITMHAFQFQFDFLPVVFEQHVTPYVCFTDWSCS